jgi:two-component system, chemotaxis family, response regulator Rcp1
MSIPDKPGTVMLLVEDNRADVVLFKEALDAAGISVDLRVVDNGADAVEYLRREGQFAQTPRPDVIVLDLNLPRKTGKEVLAEIMIEPTLNDTPVAILTTSKSEAHLANEYTFGRCLYFTKTGDFQELQRIAKQIEAFALSLAGRHGAAR